LSPGTAAIVGWAMIQAPRKLRVKTLNYKP